MKQLQVEIKEFIAKRNWQRYHCPKKLVIALSIETAELLEIFQWLIPEQSQPVPRAPLKEICGIMIYLTTLAAVYDLDPLSAAYK